MVKWISKGCSRCGGTTYVEKNGDETQEKCLMCSNSIQIRVRRKEETEDKESEVTVKS